MQVPPEISVKGIEVTPYLNELIARGIDKLERVCDYIISTRIALEQAQGSRQTGNPYRMRIYVRIPERPEIVVRRYSKASKKLPDGLAELQIDETGESELEPRTPVTARRLLPPKRGAREEPLFALIRRTFDSAQRQLAKEVEKQHGQVKTPAQEQTQAVVERLFSDDGYGFLRSMSGEEIYFHKNSVLHGHWEGLATGATVRYSPELGEKGLQASSVEVVDKPGAAEAHGELHGFPAASASRSSKGKKRKNG